MKCVICNLTIGTSIPYVGWIVRAQQNARTGQTVATNEIQFAQFHEGCYHSAEPALNKFMSMLASGGKEKYTP